MLYINNYNFERVRKKCNHLIKEMAKDLSELPHIREFIVVEGGACCLEDKPNNYFAYDSTRHEKIEEQLAFLEGCNFIENTSLSKYLFKDCFVELLVGPPEDEVLFRRKSKLDLHNISLAVFLLLGVSLLIISVVAYINQAHEIARLNDSNETIIKRIAIVEDDITNIKTEIKKLHTMDVGHTEKLNQIGALVVRGFNDVNNRFNDIVIRVNDVSAKIMKKPLPPIRRAGQQLKY